MFRNNQIYKSLKQNFQFIIEDLVHPLDISLPTPIRHHDLAEPLLLHFLLLLLLLLTPHLPDLLPHHEDDAHKVEKDQTLKYRELRQLHIHSTFELNFFRVINILNAKHLN